MKKISIGILCGIFAGILDLIPMIIQKLPLTADLSAFSMWVVIGFLLSVTGWKINSILKGIIISLLVLTPCAVIIGSESPLSLLPILAMTIVLGALLGFFVDKLTKKY